MGFEVTMCENVEIRDRGSGMFVYGGEFGGAEDTETFHAPRFIFR
jgi:hypothetical protein